MPEMSHVPRQRRNRGRRARRTGLLAAVLILAGVVGYAGWWYVAAEGLRDAIERWRAEPGAGELVVEWESLRIGGFPGEIRVTINTPNAREPGVWRWHTETLDLTVIPWALNAVQFEAPRPHLLEKRSPQGEIAWRLEAESLSGVARKTDGDESVEIALRDGRITVGERSATLIHALDASLRRSALPLAAEPGALSLPVSHSLSLDLISEETVAVVEWPFEDRRQNTSLKLDVRGAVTFPVTSQGLEAWRDSGGVVDLERFSTELGPLSLSGDGTVSLDSALQPLAAFTLNAKGYAVAVDVLAARGRLPVRNAGMLKTFLDMFSRIDREDGVRTLSVPLTIQDGKIFIGPFELGEAPRIDWPNG